MAKKLTMLYVLEPFLLNQNEQLHLTEVARRLKEPHPTVRQHISLLEQKGIVKKSRKGRLALYKLNIDDRRIMDYIIVAEKSRLIKKCDEELRLKEFVSGVQFLLGERSAALIFGSATESLKAANDVDILVNGKFNAPQLEKLAERLNLKLHLISVKRLSDVNAALKKEISKKHLLVSGSENFVRWLFW